MEPLYSTPAGGMRLLSAILLVLLAIDLVAAIALLLFVSTVGALSGLVGMLVLVAVVWLVLPRRYEVWPDRLSIVFPAWRWNIRLDDIETVRPSHGYESYAFAGVRFATAPSQSVTILRRNANMITHPNIVISPSDRDEFLRQLQRAMRRWCRQRMASG